VGISLLGTVREHILGIATGTGANGKSTMVEALGFALGDYSHTAEQELLLGTRRESGRANPALFALRGTRFVVTSETKEGVELNTAVMKNVTGGDKITTRDLYSSSVTFEPTWTILIVTNYLPDVSASDDAAWRRIRVIPFDVVVPLEDRDPTLGDKLRLEADGILTWAVEGFQQYLRNGYRMNTPPQVELATSRYRDDSDDVSKFLHARAELSPNNLATRSEIWTAWQTWAKDESATIGKQSDLYKALELRGCRAAMPRIDGKQARSYYGIKILPDDAQIDTDDTIIDSIEQE
jgi:putative DNA primase/helicase